MKLKTSLLVLATASFMNAQNVMTPEKLWTLNKLAVSAVSPAQDALVYNVGTVDLKTEKTNRKNFFLNLKNNSASSFDLGKKSLIQWDRNGLYAQEGNTIFISKDSGKSWIPFYTVDGDTENIVISPDGKKIAFSKQVQVEKLLAKDKYSDTPKSTGQIYTDLNHRHWDYYNEGRYNHIFVNEVGKNINEAKDLLEGKAWDSPQRPFGGSEDFVWSPDSTKLLYVTKPLSGAEYAKSTNTDIFAYDLAMGTTKNLTQANKGYDMSPKFSPDGKYLSWLSMARDGFEADKNDLKIMEFATGAIKNLTQNWDETAAEPFWSQDSKTIYFAAPFRGTKQLFALNPQNSKIQQLTRGNFDVNDIVAKNGNSLYVTRTDFNHNADLYSVDLKNGAMRQVTDVNKENYAQIKPSKSELKMVKTSDGKEMGVWFIYPPDFDASKKYPTLLYCQGGPQSALTQFFSTRWNFALMAANGYIVVAPNRRGMPGWGTKWNEQISQDWGGQPIRDYLAATDFAKTLPYVDGDRMACVGASYGGYSTFMLAGVHQNRFKTFIAHDGLFDMKSWALTTEELWFANWDVGSLFTKPLPKAFMEFNPSNYVEKWNRPMMIIQGGTDYRVPYEQGQEAFQAAKLLGLKSKFLYFPNENHWVLHPQNALVWQREFFEWLKETL